MLRALAFKQGDLDQVTICTAGLSKEGIIIVSDCRVSYGNIFSDGLQKTYQLTKYSTLSFAGDIYCAKFIITGLVIAHLESAAKKRIYILLKQATKQIRKLYGIYSQKRPNCYVSFLLTGYSDSNSWIGKCESPKFVLDLTNRVTSARTIGDTPEARQEVNKSMIHSMTTDFTGNNLAFLAATYVDQALDIVYIWKQEKYTDRDREHGVSGLLTLNRLAQNGLEYLTFNIEMYKGSIADRNDSLGYAKTNSVSFDSHLNKLRVHNHQTGKSNILSDIYSFNGQRRGIINTQFDPYKLKG